MSGVWGLRPGPRSGAGAESRTLAFGRVSARPGQGRLPVVLVTGFLGAGKTTLIRALLQTEPGRGSALIVNEFGEIGIDDVLLRSGSERTVLLGNGCVCCVTQSDLQRTLRALFTDRATGRVPNFARVIIETSGLADPAALLQTFAADRALAQHYALSAVIAVVDAATALQTASPEWTRQVMLADRIVLTKADLVDAAELQNVLDRIAAMTPATVARAEGGLIDPAFLLAHGALGWQHCDGPTLGHAQAYTSFVLTYEQPLNWAAFAQAMRTLADLRGTDLLRVKGFLNIEGRPVLVQFVQHLAHPPEQLADWPDADRRTRLVFITCGLARPQVQALLDAVFALASW